MKRILSSLLLFCVVFLAQAQETFPINGIRDVRSGLYAFTNATIIQNENTKIEKATLIKLVIPDIVQVEKTIENIRNEFILLHFPDILDTILL